MATLLNLQPPAPRDERPPFAELLAETCTDAAALRGRSRDGIYGPPVLAASALHTADTTAGPLWLRLDVAPDALPAAHPDLARIEIDCPLEHLDDAVALAHGDPVTLPARLAIRALPADGTPRGWAAESAERIAAAGAHPVLAAGLGPDDVADFLAVLAHTDAGFVAHATSADDVIALLAATVAALRGDDIPTAYRAADPAPVAALSAAAAGAVREVLVAIAVPAGAGIERHLRERGITADLGVR